LPETIEAINCCKDAGVKLMTALQRRFDPNFVRVKQAIAGNEVGEVVQIKLCSRDPSPPPFEYVKGGGGIFKDMAVHDLDMARYLMDSEPAEILASGSCQIDKAIEVLPGAEAFDTANIVMRFANGKEAIIDVCRQAPYGYDQRAEVLGKTAMIMTDNTYPNTARLFSATFTGNADMPYDFFMSRYKEAYVQETLAFVDSLVNNKPVPCSGEDGLTALVMAIAAGKSADEKRWVKFSEMADELCALQVGLGGSSRPTSARRTSPRRRARSNGASWRRCFFRAMARSERPRWPGRVCDGDSDCGHMDRTLRPLRAALQES